MSNFPSLTGKKLIKALRKAGFDVIRIRGSHHFLQHSDGRCTTVPVHSGETIGSGLLNQILKDSDMSREELLQITSIKVNYDC
ncbi:type II toxin-antitoxin system HicA family toxin [Deltaproteobacteria bacterium TL4]